MIDSIAPATSLGPPAAPQAGRSNTPGNADFAQLLAQAAPPAAAATALNPDKDDKAATAGSPAAEDTGSAAQPVAGIDLAALGLLRADSAMAAAPPGNTGEAAALIDALPKRDLPGQGSSLTAQTPALAPQAPPIIAQAVDAAPLAATLAANGAAALTECGAGISQNPLRLLARSQPPAAVPRMDAAEAVAGAAVGSAPPHATETANIVAIAEPLDGRADAPGAQHHASVAFDPAASVPGPLTPAHLSTAAPSAFSANPASTLLIAAPVDSSGWSKDLGQHLIRLAVDGQPSAEIHLHPADLGPIRISIALNGQDTTINFAAAHAQTRSALENALPALRDMFAASNLSLESVNVSANAFSHNSSGAHYGRHPPGAQGHTLSMMAGDETAAPHLAVHLPVEGARVDLFA